MRTIFNGKQWFVKQLKENIGLLFVLAAIGFKVMLLLSSDVGSYIFSEDNSRNYAQPISIEKMHGCEVSNKESIERYFKMQKLIVPKEDSKADAINIYCAKEATSVFVMRGFFRHHYSSWLHGTSQGKDNQSIFASLGDQYGLAGTYLGQLIRYFPSLHGITPRGVATVELLSSVLIAPVLALTTRISISDKSSQIYTYNTALIFSGLYILMLSLEQLVLSPGFAPLRYLPQECIAGIVTLRILMAHTKTKTSIPNQYYIIGLLFAMALINSLQNTILILLGVTGYLSLAFVSATFDGKIQQINKYDSFVSRSVDTFRSLLPSWATLAFAVAIQSFSKILISTGSSQQSILASASEGDLYVRAFISWILFWSVLISCFAFNNRSFDLNATSSIPGRWTSKSFRSPEQMVIGISALIAATSLYSFWYWGSPNHFFSIFMTSGFLLAIICNEIRSKGFSVDFILDAISLLVVAYNKSNLSRKIMIYVSEYLLRIKSGLLSPYRSKEQKHAKKLVNEFIFLIKILIEISSPIMILVMLFSVMASPFKEMAKLSFAETSIFARNLSYKKIPCNELHSDARPVGVIYFPSCYSDKSLSNELSNIDTKTSYSKNKLIISSGVLSNNIYAFEESLIGSPSNLFLSHPIKINISSWENLISAINNSVKTNCQVSLNMSSIPQNQHNNIANAIEEQASYIGKQNFSPAKKTEIESFRNKLIVFENKNSLKLAIFKLLWIREKKNLSSQPELSVTKEIDRKLLVMLNRIWLYNYLLKHGWKEISTYHYHSVLQFDVGNTNKIDPYK